MQKVFLDLGILVPVPAGKNTGTMVSVDPCPVGHIHDILTLEEITELKEIEFDTQLATCDVSISNSTVKTVWILDCSQ